MTSAIPSLVSTSETTPYTLHKASGRGLLAYLTIETSGTAWWGFNMTALSMQVRLSSGVPLKVIECAAFLKVSHLWYRLLQEL